MAPPLPLSTVAGTLALSFTAGRAAPATTPAPVQEPSSVPAPPRLPPLPGDTEPTTAEPATPAPDATTTEPATPEPSVEAEPATPEVAPVQPMQPVPPPELDYERPTQDDAPDERLLRPNHRPLMFNLFVGGSRTLRGGYSFLSDLKIEGALGGFGKSFRTGGFAVVQVTKGLPFTTFTLAPRLSLNRQIVPNHAFYFTTNVTIGYRLSTYRDEGGYVYDGYGGSSYDSNDRYMLHSAVMGVSWGASVILAERLVLSFRPAEFELVVPAPDSVQLNWSAMAGLGVVWGGGNEKF